MLKIQNTAARLFPNLDTANLLLAKGLREENAKQRREATEVEADFHFREFKLPGQPLRIWVDAFADLIAIRVGTHAQWVAGKLWFHDAKEGLPIAALEYALRTGLKSADEKTEFLKLAKKK
jgi:hypothetical protein